MEISERLTLFQQTLNSPDGLQPEDFADAVFCIQQMTADELLYCYLADRSSGISMNSENHLLRGLIMELLDDTGINYKDATCDSLYTTSEINLQKFSHEVIVVSPDKTVRAREEIFFQNYADNFNFPEISGFYDRKLQRTSKKSTSKTTTSLPCTVVGACFTDRVMMPMFLSSLIIKLFKDDLENDPINLSRWAPKANREYSASAIARPETLESQPISEKSFRTTPEIWSQLFTQLDEISKATYGTSCLCLRDFFFKALEAQELFLDDPEQILNATRRQDELNRRLQQQVSFTSKVR